MKLQDWIDQKTEIIQCKQPTKYSAYQVSNWGIFRATHQSPSQNFVKVSG